MSRKWAPARIFVGTTSALRQGSSASAHARRARRPIHSRTRPLDDSQYWALAVSALGAAAAPLRPRPQTARLRRRRLLPPLRLRPPRQPFADITYDRTGVGDTSIFAPLDLPRRNIYRSGSGAPGPKYWQNRADYDIKASLDTTTKTLTGTLRLRYTNNSPDTLRFIWMQIEQNAFKDKSLNSYIFPQDSRFGARGFEGGDVIERFDQILVPARVAWRSSTRANGTVMKVDLAEPLAPGTVGDVRRRVALPDPRARRRPHGSRRRRSTSSRSGIRASHVYDDVRGWNTEPYLGQGEFYLEYGDYTVDDHRAGRATSSPARGR